MLAQLRSTCACQCSSAGGESGRGGTARAHRQDTDGDAGEAGAQDTASHTAKNGVHKGEVDLLRNMLTQLQAEYDKQTRKMEATTRELAALREHVGMPAAADDLQVRHPPDDTLDMYACTIERLPEAPNAVYLRVPFSPTTRCGLCSSFTGTLVHMPAWCRPIAAVWSCSSGEHWCDDLHGMCCRHVLDGIERGGMQCVCSWV